MAIKAEAAMNTQTADSSQVRDEVDSVAVRVVLADDHKMFLQGLIAVLGRETDIEIVGHCGNGREALELAEQLQPDVLVLDITMPGLNGIEACRELRKSDNHPPILILSVHNDEQYISQALAAGASGYLLKEAATEDLAHAIREVANGHFYLGDGISAAAIEHLMKSPKDPYESLSPREHEVFRLTVEGKGNREIGEALSIGPKTVDTHKRRLMKKLGLETQVEMLKYAIRRGIIRV